MSAIVQHTSWEPGFALVPSVVMEIQPGFSRRQRGPTLHRMFEGLHLSWQATNQSSEIWTQTEYESATVDLAQNCFWLGSDPVSVWHRSRLTPTQIQLRSVLDLPASRGGKLGAMKWDWLVRKRGTNLVSNSSSSHFERKQKETQFTAKLWRNPKSQQMCQRMWESYV